MKLNVLKSAGAEPWYSSGLRFACTQCGNCCSGPPGFVWISGEEIGRLAEYLGISRRETTERYCRKMFGRWSLKESKNPRHGGHDCVFLKDGPAEQVDGKVAHGRRVCSIYPVRPQQCRTWPFWKHNLSSAQAWEHAARKCPGMGQGEVVDRATIEERSDQG
jgi:uncharacterized protein